MFDGGYLAVCTARNLGWKRVHGIVHKRSRALEHSLSTSRLARVGRRHASVDEGDSKAVLLSRRTDKGYRNRLAGSGRPGPARASRISWDRDGLDRVGPAVSRGLVVQVTQDSFSKPFLWLHRSEDRTGIFRPLLARDVDTCKGMCSC